MAAVVEPERLVFVDECGTHTSLAPIYGYAPKGERLSLSVPRGRGKNTTLLSSMSLEGMGPSIAVESATTSAVFETYMERVLAPTLREGQVVTTSGAAIKPPLAPQPDSSSATATAAPAAPPSSGRLIRRGR